MGDSPCGRPTAATGGRRCASCGDPPPHAPPDTLYWCPGPPGEATFTHEDGALATGAPLVEGHQIREVLGSGASATVYRAWSEELAREVALKVFRGARLGPSAARLEREGLRGAAAVDGVVQVVASGESAGVPWLAMECVDGPTLAALLKPPRPPLRLLVTLVARTARIVAELHRVGVVHRDLKPSNILVHADGRPVVADLGVALGTDDTRLTRTGQAVGTLRYMAPEQAAGRVEDWPRVDVHALGVTLSEVLGGADEPALRAIARRASAPAAGERTPGAAQLAHELDLWLQGRDLALWMSAPRVRRRLLTGAAGVVGLAALVLALPRQPAPPRPAGWWTFEPGREGTDLAGLHAPVRLGGTARIADGRLDVDTVGALTTGWAVADGARRGVPSTAVAVLSLDSTAGLDGEGFVGVPVPLSGFGLGAADLGVRVTLATVRQRLGDGSVLTTLCRDGVEVHRVGSREPAEGQDGVRVAGLNAHLDELRVFEAALDCATTARLPAAEAAGGAAEPAGREPEREPGRDRLETALARGVQAGWTIGWAHTPGEALRSLTPGGEPPVVWWRATPGDWLGLYVNRSTSVAGLEVGLAAPPGAVLLHPGREGEWAVARFAPAWPGRYRVSVSAAQVDADATSGAAELWVDGAAIARKALVPGVALRTESEVAVCTAAEVWVGDGGDGYSDDAVRVQLDVDWVQDTDTDGDRVLAPCDRCPDHGTGGYDADRDGCVDDVDHDGVPDDADACVGDDRTGDADADGVCADRDGEPTSGRLGWPRMFGG